MYFKQSTCKNSFCLHKTIELFTNLPTLYDGCLSFGSPPSDMPIEKEAPKGVEANKLVKAPWQAGGGH